MSEALIAKNIKKLHQEKKITLQELADLTSLTKGYLSKVERSQKAPPYSTVNKIAIALGVDVTFLLSSNLDTMTDIRLSFTRDGEGKLIETLGSFYGYGYEALAPDKPAKNMEPYIIYP